MAMLKGQPLTAFKKCWSVGNSKLQNEINMNEGKMSVVDLVRNNTIFDSLECQDCSDRLSRHIKHHEGM